MPSPTLPTDRDAPASLTGPPGPTEPVRIRLTRTQQAAVVFFGLLFTVFAVGSMYVFTDQLRTVRDQDRKQTGLSQASLPVLREARRNIPAERDALERTRRLLRTAQPLAEDLRPVVEDLGPAVAALEPAALRALVAGTAQTLAELRDRDLLARSSRTLGATQAFLERAERAGLVEDAARASRVSADALPELLRIQRRTLEVQLQTLAIQRQALAETRTLRGIAAQTLRHAESIDRKTGGDASGVAAR